MYLLLLIDKQLNLTFKICLLDLLAFFASTDTDENLNEDKRQKWSNDLCRTQEYHEYQAAIRKILSAFELSSSFILFELLIWMLCCEQHHIFEEEILFSISRYVINLNNYIKQTNLLDYIYSIIYVIDELDAKLDLTSQTLMSMLINKVCTYRLLNHMYTILNK
ncbi:unnamed protein product [Rotaria sordida]|uniref:Uncharacterized protein n=1 Tax=Rotaria sordida TaxID=392033 RepID=A0A815IIF3_9BILA|nr:unnamed protein product [Rotaria sordida]CAF1387921.1 unnamed protein product [Rotaria sordida]CAF1610500.1 unnamed protein product [Rotaria sordida]CAF4171673.1 unnamed protein product [Rotaria sordida]